jgi:hypothetical protein
VRLGSKETVTVSLMDGFGVSVKVGVSLTVGVSVKVGVSLDVGVSVKVGVSLGVGVSDSVGVAVYVREGVINGSGVVSSCADNTTPSNEIAKSNDNNKRSILNPLCELFQKTLYQRFLSKYIKF